MISSFNTLFNSISKAPNMSFPKPKPCLAILLLLLLIANILSIFALPIIRFRYIIIHHTASEHDNYESIRRYHITQNNNLDAAYHLILSNGSTNIPAGHLEATSRYRHLSYSTATSNWFYNINGIHLCIVGNFENHPIPENLASTAGYAIASLQKKFHIPDSNILLHRDINPTKCPGKHISISDINHWVQVLAKNSSPAIQKQQAGIIDHCWFSLQTFPRKGFIALAILNTASLLTGVYLCRHFSRRQRKYSNTTRRLPESDSALP
jgi:hypothetical protein